MQNDMSKRDVKIDILRGISMIFIVLGHSGFPYTKFIYLFHLAIFFIISGYCYKENKIKTFNEFINYVIKKVKKLYLPYIVFNILCVLLNNIFIKLNLYSLSTHNYYGIKDYIINIVKVLLFRGNTEMLGATWFLEILFYISILYALTDYLLNKIKSNYKRIINIGISIFLLLIGYLLVLKDINVYIKIQILTCYIMFNIGNEFKKIKLVFNDLAKILLIFFSFVVLYIMQFHGEIEISLNKYTNPVYFVTVSIAGWVMLYEISVFLARTKFFKRIFSYVGESTMWILFLHFVVFKLVNLIGICLLKQDISGISTYPILYKEGYWWIIYTTFGVVIPIITKISFDYVKKVKRET